MATGLTPAGRIKRVPIGDIGLAVAARRDRPCSRFSYLTFRSNFVKIVKWSPRTRILDAAMLVFRRHGFRRSSIEQAAEAAGLTRQALYHHFKSKEALFRAVIERLHEDALAAEIAAASAAENAGRQPRRHPRGFGHRQARATGRLARWLAPCRGTVLRTSAAGARPLPEIHRPPMPSSSPRRSRASAASRASRSMPA